MAATDAPRGLTDFDAAFLKAYYRGQPTLLPTGKAASVAKSINKALVQTVVSTGTSAKAGASPSAPLPN